MKIAYMDTDGVTIDIRPEELEKAFRSEEELEELKDKIFEYIRKAHETAYMYYTEVNENE